ncbi:ATP-dependent sacrificial sulfur transferase LarE [Thermodesulfovibrionales bacterium]|nr:ATP-dependent sacrificial sulfur transferase LarE [Thermodesulfovibrionales bacterium]MCL0030379.1 ATP-dependent sacrificial sulfur transferase LarE [Thermodesulfovibrionales bacterium]MCL0033739.1 ATP-dependent sacrificial sulfur transferase LarE [Thermodesulfovibrionales bacterium]MCL0040178.1 ATP-dependent sacrificial sulfur transferase LarE [Thermodesulfovibrionales bacterium]MCL0040812.1 ATP-dependent sacrificial sulfur transferase LarE [Thermodesulfovibrionales bacterium]
MTKAQRFIDSLEDKFDSLRSILKEMQSAVIAFSGGVDSTFLLKAMKESGSRHLAVTAYSEIMPRSEFRYAKDMARLIGTSHRVIRTNEINNPDFTKNSRERCFYCKDELFSTLLEIAGAVGYDFVIDGTNTDDLTDWRPGREAAINRGISSPLVEAGLSKDDIRSLSKATGLPTWSRPASPCLSSRFPYGVEITRDALKRVEESEEFLKCLGFNELRVRSHNDMARIEVRVDEVDRLFSKDLRGVVVGKLKRLGFKYITIDIEGFRSGSLNE